MSPFFHPQIRRQLLECGSPLALSEGRAAVAVRSLDDSRFASVSERHQKHLPAALVRLLVAAFAAILLAGCGADSATEKTAQPRPLSPAAAKRIESFKEEIALFESRPKSEDPEYRNAPLYNLGRLADAAMQQGKLAEAEAMFLELVAAWRRVPPSTLGLGLWHTRNSLAETLVKQGKYAEAEPVYRAVYQESAEHGTTSTEQMAHPNVPTDLSNLAMVLDAQGKHVEAEAAFREAVTIAENTFGADPGRVLGAFAESQRKQGKFEHARSLAERALAIQEENLRTGWLQHAQTLDDTLDTLAEIHAGLGNEKESMNYAARAKAIRDKAEK